ncbi:MAG: amino acid adenylation domain-containing protein, partial [Methanobrevibacter sp.]|nr:amino acid adenylation domain-containing protein [Candidatus Methanovirga meridionalis]
KDKTKLISSFDNSLSNPYTPQTIQHLFEKQADKTPNNVALVYNDISLTYEDLNNKANIVANYLIDNYEVKPDDLISLLLNRSENMIIAILGVLKSGAGYVPISPSNPKDRIDYIVEDTNSLLLLDDDKVDKILKANSNIDNPITKTTPNNLAYVIYTSGTTGNPKGVMVEHRGVGNLFQSLLKRYGLSKKNEKILFFANYVFDIHVKQLFLPLFTGNELIMSSDDHYTNIQSFIEYINKNNITHIEMTPSLIDAIDLSLVLSLKRLSSIGEPLTKPIIDKHINNNYTLINTYGPTETTDITTTYVYNKQDKENIIGLPIDNTSIYILDSNLNLIPKGAIGEIHIGGVGLSRGYINNKTLTQEKFIPNPYQTQEQRKLNINNKLYKSGDLARINRDNQIEFIGRKDNQVKIRGFRIEINEIDSNIQKIKNIKNSITISKDNHLITYYVGDVKQEDVMDNLSKLLPSYMVPSIIQQIDRMPLNTSGKVDKNKLPDIDINKNKQIIKPSTLLEENLLDIFSSILNIKGEKISIDDNFFYLGGDSIEAIMLVNSIAKQLNGQVSVKDIFEGKTIRNISKKIENTKVDTISEQGILKGNVPFLPIQQYFFNNIKDKNYYNQSFVLSLPKDIDINKLNRSLIKLINHHDMLRTYYMQDKGIYKGFYDGNMVSSLNIGTIDATNMKKQQLETQLTKVQSSLRINKANELYKITLIKDNDKYLLHLTFHHLIIDAVSWRIISKDLKQIYYKDNTNDYSTTILGEKQTSYRQFQKALDKYSKKNNQIDYFTPIIEYVKQYNKKIEEYKTNTLLHKTISFDKDVTNKLLKVNNRYNTQINDILLTPLSQSLRKITKENTNYVKLESHGRQSINPKININNTIGWFTTIHPQKLKSSSDIINTLINTKEEIRNIKDDGITFGNTFSYSNNTLPLILFNYLGDFTKTKPDNPFDIINYIQGDPISSKNKMEDVISINGGIIDGELSFFISSYLSKENQEKFIDTYKESLKELVNKLYNIKRQYLTPSDTISMDKSKMTNKQHYPLTPQQMNYIFNYDYYNKTDYSLSAFSVVFMGLDASLLKKSLIEVIEINNILKTHFTMVKNKVYSIYDDFKLDIELHYKKVDKKVKMDFVKPFNLFKGPLFRFEIYAYDDEVTLLGDIHHILIDRYSLGIFFDDLLHIYHGGSLEKKFDYIDYSMDLLSNKKENMDKAKNYLEKPLFNYLKLIKKTLPPTQHQKNSVSEYIKIDKNELIDAILKKYNVNYNHLFLAFTVLALSKFMDKKNICLEYIFNGRYKTEYLNTFGLFCYNIPLFFNLNINNSIEDYLKYVTDNVLMGIEYKPNDLFEKFMEFFDKIDPPRIVYDFNNVEKNHDDQYIHSSIEYTAELSDFFRKNELFIRVISSKEFLIINIVYDHSYFSSFEVKTILKIINSIVNSVTKESLNSLDEIFKSLC